jgi:shikimate dehydrogenase
MRLYGLIGYPLSHSFSEQYFTKKFEQEHLDDCVFKSFPIETITEFPALLQSNPLLKGLGVTIPYKEKVLPYISLLSDEVKQIGATNSIKISGPNLIAYNTDITGFEKSFVKSLKPHHRRALVLGTGGASKAVQFVLKKLNIEFIVVSRNSVQRSKVINYNMITDEVMSDYTIIINCTPVGMWPHDSDAVDIPYNFITPSHYVFDLIYRPAKTLLLQKSEERGATIQNGYEMLVIQAEESWKIWNS